MEPQSVCFYIYIFMYIYTNISDQHCITRLYCIYIYNIFVARKIRQTYEDL